MPMLLIFFPLFNFFYVWILEFYMGKRKAMTVIVHSYLIIAILAFKLFFDVCIHNEVYYLTLGTWINCGSLVVNWGFIFDSLSVVMLLLVGLISGAVHFYSLGYMKKDPSVVRFISYLSLFTFFMFILVSGDNLVQLFLGWEGIGLCSYLLISFWNSRVQANKASIKALIVNRIGDFGFIFGVCLLFYFFRSVDFSIFSCVAPFYKNVTFSFLEIDFFCMDIICLFLFLGSMGKSAQIGLHTWLPDAMEGPTPVSALIHAATLVTAGVFLIIRCSPLFELTNVILIFMLFVGGLTTLFAATIAITQDDIKKVIAYSTCSQLGYMVFICGLSEYSLSLFHLVNHAFFKALLFLSAGSIIHSLSGEQDLRRFGKLIKLIPYTYSLMLLGFLALCGFPFLSGFYSKDLILEMSFSKYTVDSCFSYWLGSLSALLTAFYSFRVLYYTFWGNSLSFKYCAQNIHELPNSMAFSLLVLSVGSLFSGYFLKDAFVGFGTIFWGNSIYQSVNYNTGLDVEFLPLSIKNIPLVLSFLGIFFAINLNKLVKIFYQEIFFNCNYKYFKLEYPQYIVNYIWFFNHKWYFDFIYNYYIGYSIWQYSYQYFYKLVDKGFIEIIGPYGLSALFYKLSFILGRKSLGYIYHLNCFLIISLVILLSLVLIF